jgi:hypothetical protein
MVIQFLAPFTDHFSEKLLYQHGPRFKGDFLRVGLPLRHAKSPKASVEGLTDAVY